MKTTIELADDLLNRARAEAKARGITLRAVIEEALRQALDQGSSPPFTLRDGSVGGEGLADGFSTSASGWADILAASYGERWPR